jgi:hypothetical protein
LAKQCVLMFLFSVSVSLSLLFKREIGRQFG